MPVTPIRAYTHDDVEHIVTAIRDMLKVTEPDVAVLRVLADRASSEAVIGQLMTNLAEAVNTVSDR